jgi:hypothetical protein
MTLVTVAVDVSHAFFFLDDREVIEAIGQENGERRIKRQERGGFGVIQSISLIPEAVVT